MLETRPRADSPSGEASESMPSSLRLKFWTDRSYRFRTIRDPEHRRRLIIEAIDRAGFQKLVVAVASVGFFTDSYTLFASNVVLPMLAYVYWGTDMKTTHETAINAATLAGCMIGQTVFGVLGDLCGRRKMYGVELIIILVATAGVAMSSTGQNNSMSISGWLIFWRFCAGVGVGADYPLSAVITSEFAPTRHRATMMATVFLMQAIGQLAATLVSMAVVAGVQRQNLPPDAAIDTVWRWVIGVGAIPGVFAILFRLLIPESPRYILDVQQKMDKAGYAATFFGGPLIDDEDDLDEDDGRSMVSEQGNPAHTFLGNRHVFPGNNSQNESANPSANGDLEILPSEYTSQSAVSVYGQEPKKPAIQPSDVPVEPFSKASRADIYTFFIEERNIHYLLGTAGAWFVLDFAFFGLGMNNPQTIAKVWNADHSNSTTPYTWYTETDPNMSIFEVLNNNGLRSLVVVSVGSVLGAIIVIFAIDRFNRKNLQMYGFLILGVLLIVIGATFHVVIQTNFHGVTITLYVLCQFFFNLGPNTLTFIIPAEIFPTRYRCTCHGLSAAAGKLGSVIVQIFLSYVSFNGEGSLSPNSKWLGYVLLVFGFLMFSGAAITLLIPQTQHVAQVNGRYQNLTLEELAKGKARLKPAAAHPVERVS